MAGEDYLIRDASHENRKCEEGVSDREAKLIMKLQLMPKTEEEEVTVVATSPSHGRYNLRPRRKSGPRE